MRMPLRKQLCVIRCLAVHLAICSAKAAPSALQLGTLLGYPGSEITVEQITDEERILWATPTARERRNGLALPDSRSLIAAYRVTGRNASTFYPMLIWVAAEGAFLNAGTKQTIDLIASDEAKPVSQGGRGPFGPLLFEGLGEGGIYLVSGRKLAQLPILPPQRLSNQFARQRFSAFLFSFRPSLPSFGAKSASREHGGSFVLP